MNTSSELTSAKVGIARRFRSERDRLGLGQSALGDQLGVTRFTVAHYESGLRMPTADQLHVLGRLGFDVNFLVFGTPSLHSDEGRVRFMQTVQGIREYCRLSKLKVSDGDILNASIDLFQGTSSPTVVPDDTLAAKVGSAAIKALLGTK